jgi:outer membrane immunogenic protein
MFKWKIVLGICCFAIATYVLAEEVQKDGVIVAPVANLSDSKAVTAEVTINAKADNAVVKPVSKECKDRFRGFYLGINLGGLINVSNAQVNPGGNAWELAPADINALQYKVHFRNGGFTGGAQVGYQYQYKAFYCALETDFDYSSLSKRIAVTRACTPPVVGDITYRINHRVNWYGTLRPKIGFVVDPVVFYATGGLAYGHIKSCTYLFYSSDYGEANGTISKTKLGWTVGGGIGYGFAKHWAVNLEYLYIDLGKVNYRDVFTTNTPDYWEDTVVRTRFHDIRVGLSYLF